MNNLNDGSAALLEQLSTLEVELHRNETRFNRNRMEALLHPEFVEFGRSGVQYSRAEVLNEFGVSSALPAIHSENFDLIVLARGAALLTYVSAHVDASGTQDRQTLRASVWVYTEVAGRFGFTRERRPRAPADQRGSESRRTTIEMVRSPPGCRRCGR